MESALLRFCFFVCVTATLSTALSMVVIAIFLWNTRKHCKRWKENNSDTLSIGIFHPYCDAGGGGERVLWCLVNCISKKYPFAKIAVYTGDVDRSPNEIIQRAEQRFNIKLPENLEFIYLYKRHWVEASRYPHFTLLGQSFGSIILGYEALRAFIPDIYIDSMGYAFTYPLFSLLVGCKIAAYVHYPTISADMIERVVSRRKAYNNRGMIARSPAFTMSKFIYYRVFAALYGYAGRCVDVAMVNSTWTEEHINAIWKCPLKTRRVYPPCDTADLQKLPLERDCAKIKIISVAQFRPEKDHPLQLKSMYHLRQMVSEDLWEDIELVLIGSTRNGEDERRVKDMRDLCRYLSLENNVTFKINVSYDELKQELGSGTIGIHTMWNEHFGIGIVECMAAGLIMVAHDSGGPKADIIIEEDGPRNGFLASNEEEYSSAILLIIRSPELARNAVRQNARTSVARFSTEAFEMNALKAMEPLFNAR